MRTRIVVTAVWAVFIVVILGRVLAQDWLALATLPLAAVLTVGVLRFRRSAGPSPERR